MSGKDYIAFSQNEDSESVCPTLTFQQRVIGFCVCLGIGALVSVLSFITLWNKEYLEFAVLNTLGNVFAVCSSLFLAGPKKQLKKMFEETRLIATIMFLSMMVLTFIAALAIKWVWLTIICCILQYLAMGWYGLSYIPYARTVVKKMLGLPT